jgi:O-antigen ligase
LFPYFICLPILASTFLVNLKRGPWLGVISGFIVLAFCTRKKLFLAPIGLAFIVAICISPIRDRIIEAKDHFFITGGRSEIWQIGFELLQKYPLGIGFENSGVLREFSNTIPHNLKHFHSNLLNVAVETGWFGLLLFLCFFYLLLKDFILQRSKTPGSAWIAAGITSCFCAGLVEYNFGDSAVCNYLYIFIGLGFSLIATYPSSQSQN